MHQKTRSVSYMSLNSTLGWLLVAAAFGWGAWLDPWALRAPAGEALAARQVQGVLLAMALLQLLVGRLLGGGFSSGPRAQSVSFVTAVGALSYASGYVLQLALPIAGWVIVAGALLNAVGFGLLASTAMRKGAPLPVRVALVVIAFGMLLDAVMGLRMVMPDLFPAFLGAEDGVRLRMLRLARVAAIALSVQAILFQDLAGRVTGSRVVRWGGLALAVGAAGMPLILCLSAFGPLVFKYLLPLPADAVLFGAGVAVWLAFRSGSFPMRWGWSLVFASMVVGMLLGGFAFDGPLPAPAAFSGYLDPVRSLTRYGHAYAIVLGLLALFTRPTPVAGLRRFAPLILAVGALITLGGMVVAALLPAASLILMAGPALVAVTSLLILGSESVGPRRSPARPTRR